MGNNLVYTPKKQLNDLIPMLNLFFETSKTIRTLVISSAVFAFTFGLVNADQAALQKIQNRIIEDYPIVEHVTAEQLEHKLNTESNGDLLLFDVREESEYEVSHLPNAIRVDPDISAKEFATLYQEKLANKTVVLYCSVGRRSSYLAEKIRMELADLNAKDILNLQHGIFGWHNETRQLVNTSSPTEFVHPYSWRWSRLVERKSLIRYDRDD